MISALQNITNNQTSQDSTLSLSFSLYHVSSSVHRETERVSEREAEIQREAETESAETADIHPDLPARPVVISGDNHSGHCIYLL